MNQSPSFSEVINRQYFHKKTRLKILFQRNIPLQDFIKRTLKQYGLISQRNSPIKFLRSTLHNFDLAHFGIHLQGYRNRYIGILPNATFGNWKKVTLAKNCIRKMTALTKSIVHKNGIRHIISNGFEKPQKWNSYKTRIPCILLLIDQKITGTSKK